MPARQQALTPLPHDLSPLPMPAIPARHWLPGATLLDYGVLYPSLRQHFARIRVQVCGPLPQPRDGPLICYLNHPGWWDGHLALLIDRLVLGRRFRPYIMMEEQQLRRYRFFTWLGVFSIDRHDRAEAQRSLAYITRELAEHSSRVLYMFPQGAITPLERRPLHLYSGIGRIAAGLPAPRLLPVALAYVFRREQRPEILIRIGPAHRAAASVPAIRNECTYHLESAIDALHTAIVTDDLAQFGTLLRGKQGIDSWWNGVQAFLRA